MQPSSSSGASRCGARSAVRRTCRLLLVVASCGGQPAGRRGDDPAAAPAPARVSRSSSPGENEESAPPHLPSDPVEVPADEAMAPSFLSAGPGGRPVLSYLERLQDGGHALRVVVLTKEGFGAPETVVEGPHMLANWADVPHLASLPGGGLSAVWIVEPYELRVAFRPKGSGAWTKPIVPHRGKAREFGFPAPLPAARGPGIDLAYLQDGTLRLAHVGPEGLGDVAVLDERTCECCRVAALAVHGGHVLAYRDRGPTEVRETVVLRLPGGRADPAARPLLPAPTHWKIAGCPVNGPVLADLGGGRVALAAFDAASGAGRVQLAFSGDGGASFRAPVRVDLRAALGRMALVPLEGGQVAVLWLEAHPTRPGRAWILVRRVSFGGDLGQPVRFAETTAGRDGGFPAAAVADGRIHVVYTEPDAAGRPRLVGLAAPVAALPSPSGPSPGTSPS